LLLLGTAGRRECEQDRQQNSRAVHDESASA
jgi:hypothetical protein